MAAMLKSTVSAKSLSSKGSFNPLKASSARVVAKAHGSQQESLTLPLQFRPLPRLPRP